MLTLMKWAGEALFNFCFWILVLVPIGVALGGMLTLMTLMKWAGEVLFSFCFWLLVLVLIDAAFG